LKINCTSKQLGKLPTILNHSQALTHQASRHKAGSGKATMLATVRHLA